MAARHPDGTLMATDECSACGEFWWEVEEPTCTCPDKQDKKSGSAKLFLSSHLRDNHRATICFPPYF